jgi:hypothetical protein
MNTIPVHTRFSFVRFAAAAPALLLGVTTLPAWASDPQLQAQVAALQQSVTAQAGQIAALQTQITKLQNYVNPLANVLTYDSTQKLVRLTGVNVQIVNGQGTTPTTNGVGNLIIGYNEEDNYTRGTCTVSVSGVFDTFEHTCIEDGGTFTRSLSGSHNVVIGFGHGYSSFGGMVVGEANLITGRFAVVSAGAANTASGDYSGVSAGDGNTASGPYSGVSGGFGNTASGSFASSVSGGDSIVEGTADGWAAGGFKTPAFHSP